MAGVKWRLEDRELSDMLRNLKNGKKLYRECANDVLHSLKDNIAYATHVDTGLMQDSWEIQPLKMRDGGYAVMGEITNDAKQPRQREPYPSYEIARGGDHDAISQGLELTEMELNASILDVLEGLLK